jgi:hypothetical protein
MKFNDPAANASRVLCDLLVKANTRMPEILGPAHSLFFHWHTIDSVAGNAEMLRIRRALDELTEAVVAVEFLMFDKKPLISGHDEFVP